MALDVEVDIEPPGLDAAEDDDDEPFTTVHVALVEPDGTRRAGYVAIPGEASDEDYADTVIACVRAAAAARGPGLASAVERRLRQPDGP